MLTFHFTCYHTVVGSFDIIVLLLILLAIYSEFLLLI